MLNWESLLWQLVSHFLSSPKKIRTWICLHWRMGQEEDGSQIPSMWFHACALTRLPHYGVEREPESFTAQVKPNISETQFVPWSHSEVLGIRMSTTFFLSEYNCFTRLCISWTSCIHISAPSGASLPPPLTHSLKWSSLPLPGGLPAPICSTRTSQIVSILNNHRSNIPVQSPPMKTWGTGSTAP